MIGNRRLYMAQAQARFRLRMKRLREWKESIKMKICPKCEQPKPDIKANGYCAECERARYREIYSRGKGHGETYLERHLAKREQEAAYQDREAATTVMVGMDGFGFGEPAIASTWANLTYSLGREPTPRPWFSRS